jgi:putative drug exporter of the RND superfamily
MLRRPGLPQAGPSSETERRTPLVELIANWSAQHAKTAVIGWFALIGIAFAAGQLLGTQSLPQYDPGQAGAGEQALHQLNVSSPPTESVLIQPRGPGSGQLTYATDPQMREAVGQVAATLGRMRATALHVDSADRAGGLISADGRSALVTFEVPGSRTTQAGNVAADLAAVARVQARYPGLTVAEAGGASASAASNSLLESDFRRAEYTAIPLTLILLLIVFGALIAAGIPVILAGTAVAATVSLLAIPSRFLPIRGGTSEIVLILGMAVGVDYSLFYLRREREERAAGRSAREALRIAAATSGRAIVVSGLTVMISLAGLFLSGIELFTGMAFGTITVVGVAVVGSLTVLPGTLSLLGDWADRGQVPILGRRSTAARPSRLWAALVGRVVRHPAAWGGVAAAAMIALAIPAFGLRLGNPLVDLPGNVPVAQTLAKISAAFPGRPAPAEVVATGPNLGTPATRAAVAALERRASASGPLRPPITVTSVASGRGLIIEVPLAGNGSDGVSDRALLTLRDEALPQTLGRIHGVSYSVTGDTAITYDWGTTLRSRTPIVFAVVAGLAFLLLMIAFRSLVLPLISVLLNLLSVGAAYGVITLIFQDGWLQGAFGITAGGSIAQWVPLFMFVFLFGLSMDYHVFILSRIRERRLQGMSTTDALTSGIAASAGVVTSAAVIMVAVFSIFATLSFVDVKTLGVGLAVAVLIDATAVRGILVPAALALLGDRSWYFPRSLSWLPAIGTQHLATEADWCQPGERSADPRSSGAAPAAREEPADLGGDLRRGQPGHVHPEGRVLTRGDTIPPPRGDVDHLLVGEHPEAIRGDRVGD